MKVFFSTLGAILVAAVIIWLVFAAYQSQQARLKWDAEGRKLKQETEFGNAQMEWEKLSFNNPQFDPNAEQLQARLAEIKDAIDNDRPIPPRHWQTETTSVVQQPAPEIERPASEYVTLNRDVEVGHGETKVVIPAGSKLPVVGRTSRTVAIRFQDEVQFIPKSAASESK